MDYEPATGSGGKHYLKATHIEPKTACMGEEWTASGALKKARKKGKKPPPELPDKYRTSTGQTPDFYRIFTGQVPDEKTLEDSKTLGLKPVFNPIKELPIQSKTTKPLTHDSVNGFLLNQPPNNYETKIVINSPTEKSVFYTQRPDETTDQYFDRAIAESTPFWD